MIGSFDLSPFNTKDNIYNDNYNYSVRTNSNDNDTQEQYQWDHFFLADEQ